MEETTAASPSSPPDERGRSPVVNGLIGGVIAILLAFLPLSTMLGGAVAGYLQGGSTGDGAKAGAIAGLFAFVPVALILLVISFIVPVAVVSSMSPRVGVGGLAALFFLGFVFLLALAYTVGFGAAGGAIGAYLKEEA
jgi:hypothetical protein